MVFFAGKNICSEIDVFFCRCLIAYQVFPELGSLCTRTFQGYDYIFGEFSGFNGECCFVDTCFSRCITYCYAFGTCTCVYALRVHRKIFLIRSADFKTYGISKIFAGEFKPYGLGICVGQWDMIEIHFLYFDGFVIQMTRNIQFDCCSVIRIGLRGYAYIPCDYFGVVSFSSQLTVLPRNLYSVAIIALRGKHNL